MTGAGDLAAAGDEELVAAFLGGDQQAFDLLVRRYSQRVYAICYRYFGNAADAEDAAQEAFVALLRRGGTFKGTSSFATWMYRVATNACNDLARKRARRPQPADADVERATDRASTAASAEEELSARDLDPALAAALHALDPPSREAVVLHDVYGVPYAEIAERSGIAVGTVKSRIHRGHARLAENLRHGRGAGEPANGPDPGTAVSREPFAPRRPPTFEP